MAAYYNEHDRKAAATLRELIKYGHIAPGDVDERDIRDVRPDDLRPYTQVHLYAGSGTWSYAARLAGWRDDRPMWTFSEPCQPYSSAGKGLGDADERYLRWATHHLVTECRPETCFGEQVASSDGLTWLDTVQADMEGEGYAFRAFDLCAAGFGAPHMRQRLYFVANTKSIGIGERCQVTNGSGEGIFKEQKSFFINRGIGNTVRLAESECAGLEGYSGHGNGSQEPGREFSGQNRSTSKESALSRMAITDDNQHQRAIGGCTREAETTATINQQDIIITGESIGTSSHVLLSGPGSLPTNGHWRDADWLFCRDGKWRPVEPGTFPLAHGATERVGRLCMYGNGIVSQQAAEFIKATM